MVICVVHLVHWPDDPCCHVQMLYRAVGLTATVGWTTDRLFEAGLDNVVDINGLSVPTVELGGWIALAAWCSISVAQAVVPLVAPQKVQIVNSKVSQLYAKIRSNVNLCALAVRGDGALVNVDRHSACL